MTETDHKNPLLSLQAEIKIYAEAIFESTRDILSSGLSKYPIFVAHQHEVSLGECILDRKELGTSWTVQASTFEEFVEKRVILHEKKEFFIKKYKDPELYICLFVVVPEGANFVFIPYKHDKHA